MATASLLWTVSPSLTVETLPGWLFAAISLGFIAWSCRGPRLALVALLAVILVSVVAASVVTVQLFIGETQLFASGRLSYPIRYANGTAALILIGLPAVVGLVAGAPARLALRGMLTGVGGLLLATGSLALSRSSALGLAAAGAVLVLATRPRRAAVLTVIALALALVAASPLLFQSSNSPAHRGTGVILVVVLSALCGVVLAGLEPSLAKALRGKTGRFAATGVAIVVAASVGGIALARLGNPWDTSVRAWNEFRAVPRTAPAIETAARFKSAQSNRHDYWRVAYRTWQEVPVVGAGAGSFPVAWYRERRSQEAVTDPHGWPFTLSSELGLVGIALYGMFAASLAVTAVLCWRLGGASATVGNAAASSCAYFLVHGAVDGIFSTAAVLFVGQLAAGSLLGTVAPRPTRLGTSRVRAGAGLAALLALALMLPLLLSYRYVRRAEASVTASQALGNTRAAERWNPLAITPLQLEAEIRAEAGDLVGAERVLRAAVRAEPNRWELWVQLADVYSLAGDATEAAEAISEAERLNPLLSETLRP